MGVKLPDDYMQLYEDTEVVSSVTGVLDGVRMAPSLILQSDKDQYAYLLGIVDPGKRMNPDEEALLATVARALSSKVSKIDSTYHGNLLSNIFSMCIWNYGLDARDALLELITTLASFPDRYLDGCLHMIVSNFSPPRRLRDSIIQARWVVRREEVHRQLQEALNNIAGLAPVAPMKLKDIIDKRMPRYTDPKEIIVLFVECMLGLEKYEIGNFLGSILLVKVVDLLTELDVNISLDDVLKEEHNKGIAFDKEPEDLEENSVDLSKGDKHHDGNNGAIKGNVFADKLDSLMVVVCEHIKIRADGGHLLKVFETLSEIFRRTVLKLHKSKFAQFVMFYTCSLDPEFCGLQFAVQLTDIFVSKAEYTIARMNAISYLASYLVRAKFISSSVTFAILKRLVDWCFKYCHFQGSKEKRVNPEAHQIFYSGCQAVMYILCFRMRSIMDVPHLKTLLFNLPLDSILSHPLDPLKVCLPSIVREFLGQAKDAHLFIASEYSVKENVLESELSKAFGGTERLDMFFPFDPYLLKDSDRFMQPNYKCWPMVKKTYSLCDSEDEEFDDFDAPDIAHHEEGLEEHDDSESEDDFEFSLDEMSITPKPILAHQLVANLHNPSGMPARIRPSVSPPWEEKEEDEDEEEVAEKAKRRRGKHMD